MPDPKGPKIDLPDELVAELDEEVETPEAQTDGEGSAPEELEKSSEEEAADLKDRYLRLAADFENYKRRTLKERQDLFNYGNESLIKELLETVDNLERAREHAQESEEGIDAETLLEGVDLTHRALIRSLEKFGVQPVQVEGSFDPQMQEAIRQVETDEHPPGTIVEVYQKGYLLKDRLLRPALVVVATGKKDTE